MDEGNRVWILNSAHFSGVGKETRLLEIGSYIAAGQERIQCRNLIQPMVGEYIGLDMRAGPGVDVVSDAVKMPFKDNSFDYAICLDMLEHAEWPRDVMHEVYRVLKPGGKFFLATVFNFPIHDYPSDYWRFTPECINLLFRDAGFTLTERSDCGGALQPGIVRGVGTK